jgi:hypothetical protein
MKKNTQQLKRLSPRPRHTKLPWSGLRAKDHLSRVVTQKVKEARELEETELWATAQISRVLKYISAEMVIEIVLRETRPRRKNI